MKRILLLSISIPFIFSSCSDYKTYYPPINYTSETIEIYIDNSKLNPFDLSLVYNNVDTIEEKNIIYKVDTLNFKIDKYGVTDINHKYEKETINGEEYPSFIKEELKFTLTEEDSKQKPKIITEYKGEDVQIIIKKDGNTLESYSVNLLPDFKDPDEKYLRSKYQYIINPLSLSKYKLDTIQYGGLFYPYRESKIYSNSFITFKIHESDYFLETPPDTLDYRYQDFGLPRGEMRKLIGITKQVIQRVE